MQGKIIKGIAGFYYVHTGKTGIYECKDFITYRQKINYMNVRQKESSETRR